MRVNGWNSTVFSYFLLLSSVLFHLHFLFTFPLSVLFFFSLLFSGCVFICSSTFHLLHFSLIYFVLLPPPLFLLHLVCLFSVSSFFSPVLPTFTHFVSSVRLLFYFHLFNFTSTSSFPSLPCLFVLSLVFFTCSSSFHLLLSVRLRFTFICFILLPFPLLSSTVFVCPQFRSFTCSTCRECGLHVSIIIR